MLDQFITANREEIIRRCQAKAAARPLATPSEAEVAHGVPVFLDQLVEALRHPTVSRPDIARSALQHGHELLLKGFSVSQVVHDYGDVCQAITELAVDMNDRRSGSAGPHGGGHKPAWVSPSVAGASNRTTAESMPATSPGRDAFSPSTFRGSRLPQSPRCDGAPQATNARFASPASRQSAMRED